MGRYPRIVLVEVGTALLIRAGNPMTVELERVSIEALAQDPFSGGESIGVGVFAQTPEKVQVVLKEVSIRSYQGMSIAGDQLGELTVEVVDADILAALLGIEMNMGQLILNRSKLLAPKIPLLVPLHGIFLQPSPSLQINVFLSESLIEGFSVGLWAIAKGAENEFFNNKSGNLCPPAFPWPPDFIKNP